MARTSTPGPRKQPDWRILYAAAVTETTSARLAKRLNELQIAISRRLHELERTEETAAERQALDDARRHLRIMREALWKP
jgi:hypothetical protein